MTGIYWALNMSWVLGYVLLGGQKDWVLKEHTNRRSYNMVVSNKGGWALDLMGACGGAGEGLQEEMEG